MLRLAHGRCLDSAVLFPHPRVRRQTRATAGSQPAPALGCPCACTCSLTAAAAVHRRLAVPLQGLLTVHHAAWPAGCSRPRRVSPAQPGYAQPACPLLFWRLAAAALWVRTTPHRYCLPAPLQGFPHRASLRTLAQRLLGRSIQEGAHDSAVDAEAALQAVRVGSSSSVRARRGRAGLCCCRVAHALPRPSPPARNPLSTPCPAPSPFRL